MTRRIYWGLTILIVLLIGVTLVVLNETDQSVLDLHVDELDISNPKFSRLMRKYRKTLDDNSKILDEFMSASKHVSDWDMSNPNFTRWMQKHSKAGDEMMAASKLLSKTGGSTAEEFMTNVDNMTDKEKIALIELLINRMKASQAAIKAYIKVSREMPIKK